MACTGLEHSQCSTHPGRQFHWHAYEIISGYAVTVNAMAVRVHATKMEAHNEHRRRRPELDKCALTA